MDIILAVDLRFGQVVWGKSGDRDTYRPLDWGLSPSADPVRYLAVMQPRFLYVADLSSITGTGDEGPVIRKLAARVEKLFLDRGARHPPGRTAQLVVEVIGTETAGDLTRYQGGFLSLDMKNGLCIPSGKDPADLLETVESLPFEGTIILDISSVGTAGGLSLPLLRRLRRATRKHLYWGGGVGSCADLSRLADSGFDGAIVSTAVHKGTIPVEYIRSGSFC